MQSHTRVHSVYTDIETCVHATNAACRLFVTSLRDGFNLVPLEYIACRAAVGAHAAVAVSEFAGR